MRSTCPSSSPAPVGSLCIAPGLTELTDAAGDSMLSPASLGTDLLALQIAQPYQTDGVPRMVFTLTTDPGQAAQPTGSTWYVAMKIVNGNTTSYKAVHMTFTAPTTPTFESYTPAPGNNGSVDGRFVTSGSTKAAHSEQLCRALHPDRHHRRCKRSRFGSGRYDCRVRRWLRSRCQREWHGPHGVVRHDA